MSLESQVSALVEATNKLTTIVSNKIADINNTVANKLKDVDLAVSKVAADIRSTIKGEMRQIIYVDQINGSDDNDGKSKSKPFASLQKASSMHKNAGILDITLLSDYDIRKEIYQGGVAASFYNAVVSIRAENAANPVKIKFDWTGNDSYPEQYFMRSFQVYNCGVIEFSGIVFELPDVPSDHGPGKMYPHGASVIRSNNSTLVAAQLIVRLYHCQIEVPEAERSEWHFIGNISGFTNLMISTVTMPAAWRDRNKMFHHGKLSDTAFVIRQANHSSVLSTDNSVINNGAVK
ncbi:MAG: hypothetical protein ACRCT7_04555 [Shewanella sp.]